MIKRISLFLIEMTLRLAALEIPSPGGRRPPTEWNF